MASFLRNFTTLFGIAGFAIFCYILFQVTTPGEFSKWSDWGSCSISCGEGFEKRTRSCSNPKPGIFGYDCEGDKIESRKCNLKPCPQDGGYTEWGTFGGCDKKCGGGRRIRKRTCSNPLPLHGGKSCDHLGVSEEVRTCNIQPCPVDGGYSDWGKFSDCSLEGGEPCGKGKKLRIRTCNKPVPQHGGKSCVGPDTETVDCEIPCSTLKPTNTTSNTTITNDSTSSPSIKST